MARWGEPDRIGSGDGARAAGRGGGGRGVAGARVGAAEAGAGQAAEGGGGLGDGRGAGVAEDAHVCSWLGWEPARRRTSTRS